MGLGLGPHVGLFAAAAALCAVWVLVELISNFVQTPKDQVGYGLSGSVLDVGLYLLPSTFGMMLFSTLAGRFERRLGTAYTLAIGSLLVAASFLYLTISNGHVYDVLIYSGVMGAPRC
ncbi:hypothetical protein [Phytohabitans houttuyneae]|uniref:Uncharacterized protein n=1 Tax=Phytohabitans houttuyneae TaxID=1076126 RepID=A0A6V8KDP9_9ACTN|nr:hypothetical protein [Phytohabitans houttuyneae]GFJ83343.1 hypothetical protein Phou_075230 [Phytohabitans houttuyneae]